MVQRQQGYRNTDKRAFIILKQGRKIPLAKKRRFSPSCLPRRLQLLQRLRPPWRRLRQQVRRRARGGVGERQDKQACHKEKQLQAHGAPQGRRELQVQEVQGDYRGGLIGKAQCLDCKQTMRISKLKRTLEG